ncbi:hypothetical protein LU11_gp144 [Pseudomonas phage Lu11]|uniref:hypothetical protein n=1 Tax=Pseudomonas phage Lu11 TaxID=1161927 RepID=UPI00025F17B5|nr:hypothetical protein LU11_gp144 [Pseudomonas phage Lu11]AFH14675.1 hypothetical protein Lu11_0142 [Pseudomonas phage Lu11]
MTVEILRYEAKWGEHAEWQECSQTDYEAIRLSIHQHQFKARVIGIVEDPAGLLLPGPNGYESWREAAVHEKAKRVEIERELKEVRNALRPVQKLEAIRKILDEE